MVIVTLTIEAKERDVFGATKQHWSSEFVGEGHDLVMATNKAIAKMSKFVSLEDGK